VAAAALLGIGAYHIGLPRLAIIALVIVVVFVVSALIPRPKQIFDVATQEHTYICDEWLS
jgi:hypothetical protein